MHQDSCRTGYALSLSLIPLFCDIKSKIPSLLFEGREPIAHEPEPVWAVELQIEVFRSETFQDLFVVDDAPGVHGGDLPIHFVVLVP